ncbi:hypothetical protein P7K49_017314, partial [Saguinus oedipus]
ACVQNWAGTQPSPTQCPNAPNCSPMAGLKLAWRMWVQLERNRPRLSSQPGSGGAGMERRAAGSSKSPGLGPGQQLEPGPPSGLAPGTGAPATP